MLKKFDVAAKINHVASNFRHSQDTSALKITRRKTNCVRRLELLDFWHFWCLSGLTFFRPRENASQESYKFPSDKNLRMWFSYEIVSSSFLLLLWVLFLNFLSRPPPFPNFFAYFVLSFDIDIYFPPPFYSIHLLSSLYRPKIEITK